MDRIVLGSGKLYITAATFTNHVVTIPADATIETDSNLLGLISGGATLEYAPEYKTVEDDLAIVSKTYLTAEEVTLKSGVLTWNTAMLNKLCATGQVSTTTSKSTLKIGGLDNFDLQDYIIRFVHEDADDGDIRVTIVGHNEAGFEIQFQKDSETVVNAEFKAVPGCGTAGVKVIIDEEI